MAVAAEGFDNFFSFALIDRRGDGLNSIHLEGSTLRELIHGRAEEVGLNESMGAALGVHAGARLNLRSLTQDQWFQTFDPTAEVVPAGPTIAARVAGVARSAEDVSDAPDPFLLLTPAFYDRYHTEIGSCRCTVLVRALPGAVPDVIQHLKVIYPDAEITPAEDLTARIADTVSLQRRAWLLIALVTGVAATATLWQSATRVGRAMSSGDGARRALGSTQRDLSVGRLLVVVPAVVGGALVAIGVAYSLSPLAPLGLTKLAEPSPGLRFETEVLMLGALAVTLAAGLVTGAAVLWTGRRRMNRGASVSVRRPELALGRRLALGPGRAAILGVSIATIGIVGALTVDHSVRHVLDTPALYGADFDVSNMLDSGADKRALAEQLGTDPDVEATGLVWVQRQSSTALSVVGPGGTVEVSPAALESVKGTIAIAQTRGQLPRRPDEVALGNEVMQQLGVGIGDRVTATGSLGTRDLTVIGDSLDPGGDLVGSGFAMTLEGLATLVEPVIHGTVARFVPSADATALAQRYEALGFTPVTPPSEVGHIGELGGLPSRIAQLLSLIGLAALINAAVVTVKVGRRELAIHRALGFTPAQVIGAHLWQGVLAAVGGVAVGGAAGFMVGRAIERRLIIDVGAIPATRLPFAVWPALAVAGAVCLVVSACAGVFAARSRPVDALRAE